MGQWDTWDSRRLRIDLRSSSASHVHRSCLCAMTLQRYFQAFDTVVLATDTPLAYRLLNVDHVGTYTETRVLVCSVPFSERTVCPFTRMQTTCKPLRTQYKRPLERVCTEPIPVDLFGQNVDRLRLTRKPLFWPDSTLFSMRDHFTWTDGLDYSRASAVQCFSP
jgi:hypothetical protein